MASNEEEIPNAKQDINKGRSFSLTLPAHADAAVAAYANFEKSVRHIETLIRQKFQKPPAVAAPPRPVSPTASPVSATLEGTDTATLTPRQSSPVVHTLPLGDDGEESETVGTEAVQSFVAAPQGILARVASKARSGRRSLGAVVSSISAFSVSERTATPPPLPATQEAAEEQSEDPSSDSQPNTPTPPTPTLAEQAPAAATSAQPNAVASPRAAPSVVATSLPEQPLEDSARRPSLKERLKQRFRPQAIDTASTRRGPHITLSPISTPLPRFGSVGSLVSPLPSNLSRTPSGASSCDLSVDKPSQKVPVVNRTSLTDTRKSNPATTATTTTAATTATTTTTGMTTTITTTATTATTATGDTTATTATGDTPATTATTATTATGDTTATTATGDTTAATATGQTRAVAGSSSSGQTQVAGGCPATTGGANTRAGADDATGVLNAPTVADTSTAAASPAVADTTTVVPAADGIAAATATETATETATTATGIAGEPTVAATTTTTPAEADSGVPATTTTATTPVADGERGSPSNAASMEESADGESVAHQDAEPAVARQDGEPAVAQDGEPAVARQDGESVTHQDEESSSDPSDALVSQASAAVGAENGEGEWVLEERVGDDDFSEFEVREHSQSLESGLTLADRRVGKARSMSYMATGSGGKLSMYRRSGSFMVSTAAQKKAFAGLTADERDKLARDLRKREEEVRKLDQLRNQRKSEGVNQMDFRDGIYTEETEKVVERVEALRRQKLEQSGEQSPNYRSQLKSKESNESVVERVEAARRSKQIKLAATTEMDFQALLRPTETTDSPRSSTASPHLSSPHLSGSSRRLSIDPASLDS